MITFIVLILLIGMGIYLIYLGVNYDELGLELISVLVIGICSVCLVMHSVAWGLSGYNYGLFVEKRNAFEQTLKVAREEGNEHEVAAIVKEVAEWNTNLAVYKYDNKTLFFDQYIDDRIEELQPIK